jgi:PAS domain-containing protein
MIYTDTKRKKPFEAGAKDFVSKPLSLIMLGQRVQYMLRAGNAFRELHISRSRLAKTQELARIGNWQMDLTTNEFHCSPEAHDLLGLDCTGKTVTMDDFFSPVIHQDKERVKESLENAIKTKEASTLEYRISSTDGPQKYILNKSEILFDEHERPALILGIVQDVSLLKEAEDEIRFLAFYDGLTGLANRMLFMDRLDQAILDST